VCLVVEYVYWAGPSFCGGVQGSVQKLSVAGPVNYLTQRLPFYQESNKLQRVLARNYCEETFQGLPTVNAVGFRLRRAHSVNSRALPLQIRRRTGLPKRCMQKNARMNKTIASSRWSSLFDAAIANEILHPLQRAAAAHLERSIDASRPACFRSWVSAVCWCFSGLGA